MVGKSSYLRNGQAISLFLWQRRPDIADFLVPDNLLTSGMPSPNSTKYFLGALSKFNLFGILYGNVAVGGSYLTGDIVASC